MAKIESEIKTSGTLKQIIAKLQGNRRKSVIATETAKQDQEKSPNRKKIKERKACIKRTN